MKPILHYAKKLTLEPARVTEGDAAAIYDVGWGDDALYSTVLVTALFNLYNRLVEGVGLTLPDGYVPEAAKRLSTKGLRCVRANGEGVAPCPSAPWSNPDQQGRRELSGPMRAWLFFGDFGEPIKPACSSLRERRGRKPIIMSEPMLALARGQESRRLSERSWSSCTATGSAPPGRFASSRPMARTPSSHD